MIASIIFCLSYVGIALGKIPGLQIDRVGVALLGAIAMVVFGVMPLEAAFLSIDLPTILLLYSLMIVSAQLRLGGFYTWVALRIVPLCQQPHRFLLAIMLVSAVLSAVLANDIVCFTLTPILAVTLVQARLDPLPFLIGLAVSSNIGSAATLIGNPQNMLLGQTGSLNFAAFFYWCLPPAIVSLLASYLLIRLFFRTSLRQRVASDDGLADANAAEHGFKPFDRWQSVKGGLAVTAIIVLFLTPIPREISALAVAGLLLCSRRMKTKDIISLVDWHLITLFCALFVIIHGIAQGGMIEAAISLMDRYNINLRDLPLLAGVSVLLSNILSNVPAVMLLQKFVDPTEPVQWYVLAVSSTFAGNLILIGSIANLIVVEQAARYHIRISFVRHAVIGIPVTLVSLVVLLLWLSCNGYP